MYVILLQIVLVYLYLRYFYVVINIMVKHRLLLRLNFIINFHQVLTRPREGRKGLLREITLQSLKIITINNTGCTKRLCPCTLL